MTEILLGIANHFDADLSLQLTRWNAILWSIADIIVCVLFLDAADRVRQRPRAFVRWAVLAVTIIATPILFVVGSQGELLKLEAFICGLQFFVLIWTAIADARPFLRFYHSYFRG